MKSRLFALLLLVASPGAAQTPAIDAQLQDRDWLLQVVLYSYYWYLNDAFFVATQANQYAEAHVRQVEPEGRDDDDKSQYAEMWLPHAKVLLTLKKADYRIDELNLIVRSPGFRVIRGSYEEKQPGEASEWAVIKLPRDEILSELRSTRHQLQAPTSIAKTLVLAAIRKEMATLGDAKDKPQKLYIAARTSVSTDVWVFWEDRRTLFRISGDMDITDPSLIEHLPMLVRRYDLGSNVVASIVEAEGLNNVISRDFASRALFVCLARGEAVTLIP